jgi:RNA polymerase sigma factor (sigma-70 family)
MAMVKRFYENIYEGYAGVVSSVSYEFSRKYRMVDVDDLRQELWLWFLTHPNKVKYWHDVHDSKQSTKLVARSLRNTAKDYCQKEKAKSVGFRVEDNYYYDKNMLESLIPAVLTGNREAPVMNDLSVTNVKKVASEGNNWPAICSDIEKAISKLNKEQRDIVILRYASGLELGAIASELSISQDAVRMRVNRALKSMLNFLGGNYPRKERDFTDEEVSVSVETELINEEITEDTVDEDV